MSMARRSNGRAGSPARFAARMLPGARPSQFPGFIAPCNPTLKPVGRPASAGSTRSSMTAIACRHIWRRGGPRCWPAAASTGPAACDPWSRPLNELPASSNCISIFSTKHVGKVGTGFRRKVARAAPRSGLARHTFWHTLLQRCGGCPLAVHLAKQSGPFPFLAMNCTTPISDAAAIG